MSERVFVSEYGHGARSGHVVNRYVADGRERVVVKLDDQDCPRDCFATSVFTTRDAAEEDAKP